MDKINWKNFLLLHFLSFMVYSYLHFKITQPFEGFQFSKDEQKEFSIKKSGEDSYATSRMAISISDGIGGCSFNSKYFSNAISIESILAVENIGYLNPSDFLKDLQYYMNDITGKFTQSIIDIIKNKGLNDEKVFPLENLDSGSTFILTSVSKPIQNQQYLMIFQVGDSLVVVYRKTKIEGSENLYYYFPIYQTEPKQSKFNTPYCYLSFPSQFKETCEFNANTYIFKDSIEIQEDDIVIIGSDGLFDNVSVSFITLLVNVYVKLQIDQNENFNQVYEKLVEQYYQKILQNIQERVEENQKEYQNVSNQQPNNLLQNSKQKKMNDNDLKDQNNPYKNQILLIDEQIYYNQQSGFSQNTFVTKNFVPITIQELNEFDKEPEFDAGLENYKATFLNTDFKDKNLPFTSQIKEPQIPEEKTILSELYQNCKLDFIIIDLATKKYEKSKYNIIEQKIIEEQRKCYQDFLQRKFVFTEKNFEIFRKNYETEHLSYLIAYSAHNLSFKEIYPSPFYIQSQQQNEQPFFLTGKPDDITVVASLIINNLSLQQNNQMIEKLNKEKKKNMRELEEDVNHFINKNMIKE